MGCDIHYVVEKKVDGRWVGLFSKYPRGERSIAGNRCYEVFGELAGVRCRPPTMHEPRGTPDDWSDLAEYHVTKDGDDGHTHSWLTLDEFRLAYARGVRLRASYFGRIAEGKRSAELRALVGKLEDPSDAWWVLFGSCAIVPYADTERDEDRVENYRVVFWFDN